MDLTAIIVVFIVIGLPTLGITLVQLAKTIQSGSRKSGGSSGANRDEAEIMQQLHLTLSRLEKRIDSLETIIYEKHSHHK